MADIIIGLDGGATKISGGIVLLSDEYKLKVTDCVSQAKIKYSELKDYINNFTPVSLNIQLEEFKQSRINLTREEKKQGNLIIEAAAILIKKILNNQSFKKLYIGIGMPGLKTSDGLGIAAMANGPRMPDYIKKLTLFLQKMGIVLPIPIQRLGSDADFCGIGENYSSQGKLANVDTAYYLGIGTGIADAMKIDGNLIPFDNAKNWIAKSWEIGENGISFEKHISMQSIEKNYTVLFPDFNDPIHAGNIFEKAGNNESQACKIVDDVRSKLALLIYDRIYTLALGGSLCNFVNPARKILEKDHLYPRKTWDSIILGQRMGVLWDNVKYNEFFQKKVYEKLFMKINQLPDEIRYNYSSRKSNLIVASSLTSAPIIGAGVSAFLTA